MNQQNIEQIYSGDIVAGSLLISESRAIARLLLDDINDEGWHQAIVIDNVLQKRSPVAAKRQAALIKKRLSPMKRELWELIHQGGSDIAVQALLAASIKHSRLVGDFMDNVMRQHWQTFIKNISATDWTHFIETCAQVDPRVETWTDSTMIKLKQVVFRILAESKYIDSTRSTMLLPVSVLPDIRKYLMKNSEDYVLRCMEITQ